MKGIAVDEIQEAVGDNEVILSVFKYNKSIYYVLTTENLGIKGNDDIVYNIYEMLYYEKMIELASSLGFDYQTGLKHFSEVITKEICEV